MCSLMNYLFLAIGRFFTPEESLSFAGFSSMADKFNSIKEMTQLQLMDVLHHHKTIDLSMDIKVDSSLICHLFIFLTICRHLY